MNELKNYIWKIGIFLGVILLMIGIIWPIPNSILQFNDIEKYVGGDAYNMIIASNIRGGLIAGIISLKVMFIGFGLILSFYCYDKEITYNH